MGAGFWTRADMMFVLEVVKEAMMMVQRGDAGYLGKRGALFKYFEKPRVLYACLSALIREFIDHVRADLLPRVPSAATH